MSWGWTRQALESAGYDTGKQDTWIAEFRRLLQDCVDIGILVSLPFHNRAHSSAVEGGMTDL
jgi:hypothetical protein